MILFSSCEKEDEIQTDSISTSIYNKDIINYLNEFKNVTNKIQSQKINDLENAIDFNTAKIYTLKTTEKLVVIDLKSLKGFEDSDKTKVIFFIYQNKIKRSNIVRFNTKVAFNNLDNVICSIWNMDKKKGNFTGKVSFYTVFQYLELTDVFEDGVLTENGIARKKDKKNIVGRTQGCTNWYWVTTYTDGTQKEDYLYTTCNECEVQVYRMANACGGGTGGGGTGSGSAGGVVYPTNPKDKELYTYIDQDGEIITKRYDALNKKWNFFSIGLSQVVVNKSPEYYYYLIFQWPYDQQKVVKNGLVYTYDAGSGNWEGVLEEDPCTIASNMTKDAQSSTFISAKSNIENASSDGLEHSITLGRDASGNITQSSIRPGGQNAVAVNTSWSGAFASLHNHPNNTQLSAGDIYSSIKLNTMNSNFTTSYILTNGQLYSIVVTDLAAAQAFATAHPADQILGYNPEFPDKIFEEIEKIQTSDMKYTSVEGKTQAISFVLDKFNSGITLMKQDSTGDFKPIKMEEIILNGNTVYNQIHCN